MAGNFEIYEDQENLREIKRPDMKRDQVKHVALGSKSIVDENALARNKLRTEPTVVFGDGGNRAFKDKNVYPVNKDGKEVLKPKKEDFHLEESIVNVTSDSWNSSSGVLEASSSFTYRKDSQQDNELATPMSVVATDVGTPMSVDKSALTDDQKDEMRRGRDRFFDVVEYQDDILSYLKKLEVGKTNRPRPEYMRKQPDINDSMRTILVDWLVEVSEEYRLQSETLCLAVQYIDRFLSYMSVVRAKLQLVGTTAMLVAAKYEEIYPPDIAEFVYITDDTYTKQQVLRMEKLLLKILTFDLNAPTTYRFVNLFSNMMNTPVKIQYMAQYLCELSMLRASPFLNYTPSQLTAAALALSHYTHGNSIWNKKMQDSFGYDLEELKEIIVQLNELHFEAESLPQQAIQEKFKANKYMRTASVEPKKITIEQLDEIIAKLGMGDELNTTAENIESVRQKTEMLFN